MDDTISRQAAIDEIKGFQQGAAEWRDEQEERSDIWHRADSAIASALEIGLRVKKLPSAQQWIPCSERLPEDDTLMLVNYIDRRPDAMDIWIGWHEMENVWYIDGEAHSREFDNEVIAWMPLPEPYKGEES